MNEEYPIHVMIKPEGLELFPDYLATQIQLLEAMHGNGVARKVRTVLTLDEVDMIYPKDSVPEEVKRYLAQNPTEHYFFHGGPRIYEEAKRMKGKYGLPFGVRSTMAEAVGRLGIKMEKWKNFIHTPDDEVDTYPICFHFNKEIQVCQNCVARPMCYRG